MVETVQIIAIHSYGSQRVKHPQTHQIVSAYKIGYSSSACEVLLTLYGANARDVSSPHTSYRYIQLDGDVSVRHCYLLLRITSAELARAEIVTRRYHRAAVYLWRDSKWFELPTNRDNTYTEPPAQSGPNFNPASLCLVSPSTGEKETAVHGIHTEKSQRSLDEKPWHWLMGDTYPHRETLKRYGARFSGRRKAWYFVGWELPEAIQRLVAEDVPGEPEPPAQADDAPCSDKEAERILGVNLAPKPLARQNEASQIQPGETWVLDAQGFHKVDEPPMEHMPEGDPAPEDLPIVSSEPAEPQHIRIIKLVHKGLKEPGVERQGQAYPIYSLICAPVY